MLNKTQEIPAVVSEIVYLGKTSSAEPTEIRGPGAWAFAAETAQKYLKDGQSVAVAGLTLTEFERFRAVVNSQERTIGAHQTDLSGADVRQGVFGDYTFAETVGIWLQSGQNAASTLLSPFLSTEGFTYDPAEYLQLKDRLHLTLRKQAKQSSGVVGLEDLNTGFFRHRGLEEAERFIEEQVTIFLQRGEALQQAYLNAINTHARQTYFEARQNLAQARRALEVYGEQLHQGSAMAGRKQRRFLASSLASLNDYRKLNKLATLEPPANGEAGGYDQLLHHLRDEHNRNIERLDQILRETAIGLSPATTSANPSTSRHLASLGQRLDDFTRDLDEVGLYQLPLSGPAAATTPRQVGILEKIVEQLRGTLRSLPGFHDFYEQRQFWYAHPPKLRRILAPLLELPSSTWEPAFTGWYFERCLAIASEPRPVSSQIDPANPSASSRPRATLFRAEDAGHNRPDFTIDFRVESGPLDSGLSIQPLNNTNASHVAVAGSPESWLFFSQSYFVSLAPDWQSVSADDAPPRLEASFGGERLSLEAAARNRTDDTLHLYLPTEFTREESSGLVHNWQGLLGHRRVLRLYHGWSDNQVTDALLCSGLMAEFLAAILIRSAESASTQPYDANDLAAINAELCQRFNIPIPEPHPLAEATARLLRQRGYRHDLKTHVPWRDTFLPLVKTDIDTGRRTVYLPDGQLPGGRCRGCQAKNAGNGRFLRH